jgi:hypothetical protein
MKTALLAFIILGACIGEVFAQTAPRTVVLERSLPRPLLPDDPIKIVKVLLDGVEIKTGLQAYPTDKAGVPFQAGDDWFNHITVVLKNISAKKIVYADIRFFFLDPLGDGTPKHPMVGDGNAVGEKPRHARYSHGELRAEDARKPVLIAPGQEFSLLAIDPDRFDEVKQNIENFKPLSSITSIRLGIGEVYFEDGTRWTPGVHYRPDFSTPGKYIVISQKEFDAYRQEASQ